MAVGDRQGAGSKGNRPGHIRCDIKNSRPGDNHVGDSRRDGIGRTSGKLEGACASDAAAAGEVAGHKGENRAVAHANG